MREGSTPMDLFDGAGAVKTESLRWVWLLILVALISILVAVAVFSPPEIWSPSQIVLFVLTALLCTLVAISLGVAECRDGLTRSAESLQPIATQISEIQDLQMQLGAVVQQGNGELNGLTARGAASQHELDERLAGLAGTLQAVVANVAALGETLQAQREAVATLTGAQEQSTNDLLRLQVAIEAVAGEVTEIAREQAAVRGVLQEHGPILTAAAGDIQQCRTALQAGVGTLAETGKQTVAALTALAAAQTAVEETVRHTQAEVAGVEARQTALHEAGQTREEAVRTALAALNAGHEQLAGPLQQLCDSVRAIAGVVTDTARQQATASDSVQVALTTLRAEQAAAHETVLRMKEDLAGVGAGQAALGEAVNAVPAAGHEQPTSEVPPLQTAGGPGPLDAAPPAPVAGEENPARLHAAQAITHGERIRYEVGPDRDNLGFWDNPNEWAQWDVDIARPGRFKVTAQIAAVAETRFQVVLADQPLQGSAPNTGDYGRFQPVEVGIVELASAGKTRVVVRPIPEGWHPMNLRLLDLARLPA